jgi:hypothetical protein
MKFVDRSVEVEKCGGACGVGPSDRVQESTTWDQECVRYLVRDGNTGQIKRHTMTKNDNEDAGCRRISCNVSNQHLCLGCMCLFQDSKSPRQVFERR